MGNECRRCAAECDCQAKALEVERQAMEEQPSELTGGVGELDTEIARQETRPWVTKAAAFLSENDLMKQFTSLCGETACTLYAPCGQHATRRSCDFCKPWKRSFAAFESDRKLVYAMRCAQYVREAGKGVWSGQGESPAIESPSECGTWSDPASWAPSLRGAACDASLELTSDNNSRSFALQAEAGAQQASVSKGRAWCAAAWTPAPPDAALLRHLWTSPAQPLWDVSLYAPASLYYATAVASRHRAWRGRHATPPARRSLSLARLSSPRDPCGHRLRREPASDH